MATGCFIAAGRSLEGAIEQVKLAESLGYESVYTTHIAGRESLTVLTAYALATSAIRLGTAVVPIYTRTPATMAQTAATIDELSGGRLNLGLGVSHRLVVEGWYGQSIDRPVAEMREYASKVRAILRGEDPPGAPAGAQQKWPTSFHLAGLDPRPQVPIYIAALSPAMLRLAGEIADGVLLWLCVPEYIASVVVPEVRAGRERAGKALEGFDIVPAVPAAVTEERDAAFAGLRRELVTYFSLPFYRAMLERAGFGEEIAAFDAAGGDFEAMQAAISERFLDALTGIGDAAAVRAAIARYRQAGATSPCLGGVPGSDFAETLRVGAPGG